MAGRRYDAVVFDLLTALINSWTLWNEAAGSAAAGLRWRKRYLEITYGCGAYQPYEELVREAAIATGVGAAAAGELSRRWDELCPWPEAPDVLGRIGQAVPLGVATNCSHDMGLRAAARTGAAFAAVVTAERAGFYKPRPEVYGAVLDQLGTAPARTLFVAGSASDVPGAAAAGMPVYWHNRIGLAPASAVQPDFLEHRLEPLVSLVTNA